MIDWGRLQYRVARGEQPDKALFLSAFLDIWGVSGKADDVLVSRVLLQPERFIMLAFWFAAGSVALGCCAYASFYVLGLVLPWTSLAAVPILGPTLDIIRGVFTPYGWLILVLVAVSSPLYIVMMALCGLLGIGFIPVLIAGAAVRYLRAVYVGWLLWRGGTRQQNWVERYFGGLTVIVAVALVLFFLMILVFVRTA
jgi:hypothetical protein